MLEMLPYSSSLCYEVTGAENIELWPKLIRPKNRRFFHDFSYLSKKALTPSNIQSPISSI